MNLKNVCTVKANKDKFLILFIVQKNKKKRNKFAVYGNNKC